MSSDARQPFGSTAKRIASRFSAANMALRLVATLSQLALSAALNAGDCAFVGIYGEQDDFAVVLLENAAGDQVYVAEGFGDKDWKASKKGAAKAWVQEAARGTVLRKKDFEGAFVAPSSLTLFKDDNTVLCSIKMEGGATRHLSNLVDLGEVDSAQYMGEVSGLKEDLLADITNPANWVKGAVSRKLQGFSIAKGNTTMMTTTTMMPNTTMAMTTTTSMIAPAAIVSGCIGATFTNADSVITNSGVITALKATIAALVDGVTADMVTSLTLEKGTCSRRLAMRQLQAAEAVTISYQIEFPASLTDAATIAQNSQTTLAALTTAAVQTQIQAELTSAGLTDITTVTVTSVSVQPVEIPGETTTLGGESGAKTNSLALGVLLLLFRMVM